MHTPSFPRSMRFLAAMALAVCAVAAPAESLDFSADSVRIVLAQASETTAPATAPGMDHGHDVSAETPAMPDPKPRLNKKRVAFWGVVFMASTSVAFVIFGVWAMRRAPKPGQQRPG